MKKVLSIALSVMLILSTLSVLMILPATAETAVPDGPVNLIVNGDFTGIDTDGDGEKDKTEYDADDVANATYPGEMMVGGPIGWRTNSSQYSNVKPYYPSTATPKGYLTNYVGVAATINQGQAMIQDIKLEAGKTYVISAKLGYRPTTTDITAQTAWKMIMGLDAKTGVEVPSASNADYTGFGVVETWKFAAIDATAETVYYGAGDMVDKSFTFAADDFIAAKGLTADEDGYYNARLIFYNYTWGGSYSGIVDEVTMYEIAGTVTAGDGGMVNTDVAYAGCNTTLVATPFYGNTFAGWYQGEELISTSATYTGVITGDVTAKFNAYNQVVDGDFESGTTAGQDYLNANKNSTNAGAGVVIDNPTTSKTIHGDKVLKLNPATAANTNADLVTIPFTAKKNTRYVMHLSYYSVDTAYTAYVGLHSAKSFTNGWTKATYVTNLTYHWQPEGTTAYKYRAWTVYGGYNGSFGMMRDQTHASVNGGANTWIDYWVTFDVGEQTSIFEDGADTAEMFFLFGIGNSATNTFYLDNISITEAGAAANTAINAVASGDGSVAAAMPFTPDSVYYADNGGAKVGSTSTAIEGSVAYSQVAVNTYTATANSGSEFVGWYDADGKLVSTNATETFYTEGTYTAKFAVAPYATDGGVIVKNQDGTYTASAYYGNKFNGWYGLDDELVSTDATYAATAGMYASFTEYNKIVDGSFDFGDHDVFVQNAAYSATVKTEENGNNYLQMVSTITGSNAFYAFQWQFKLEKGKKYVISYDFRTPTDAEGNYLSSEGSSYRNMFVYNKNGVFGNRSYEWNRIAFADGYVTTSGSKNTYTGEFNPLPSGGTDNYPREGSTSFTEAFQFDKTEWVHKSIVIDTTTWTLQDGTTDLGDEALFGMTFGNNNAGTFALDIDNLVVSEVVNEGVVHYADADIGTGMISSSASTAVLPMTYTATVKAPGYKFAGWADVNGGIVSTANPYSTFDASELTATFALDKQDVTEGDNGDFEDTTAAPEQFVDLTSGASAEFVGYTEDEKALAGFDSTMGNSYLKVTANPNTGHVDVAFPVDVTVGNKYLAHFKFRVLSLPETVNDEELATSSRFDIRIDKEATAWVGAPEGLAYKVTGSVAYGDVLSSFSSDGSLYWNWLTGEYGYVDVYVNIDATALTTDSTAYINVGLRNGGDFAIDSFSFVNQADLAPTMEGAMLDVDGSTVHYVTSVDLPEFVSMSAVTTHMIAKYYIDNNYPDRAYDFDHTIKEAGFASMRADEETNRVVVDAEGNVMRKGNFYTTYEGFDAMTPTARVLARTEIYLTDNYGNTLNIVLKTGNTDASKAIDNGVYSRSLTQMKRLAAKALIEGDYADLAAEMITPIAGKALWNCNIDEVWAFVLAANEAAAN